MPQPYRGNNVTWPFDILLRRPKLAALMAQMNAEWARIDLNLAIVVFHIVALPQYMRILATSFPKISSSQIELFVHISRVTSRMYLALSGTASKDAVLTDLANQYLLDSDQKKFEKLLKIVKSIRRRRSAIAHGLWALDEKLPDALLLQDLEDAMLHSIDGDTPRFHVYVESDFIELTKDIQSLNKSLREFSPKEFREHGRKAVQQMVAALREHIDRQARS